MFREASVEFISQGCYNNHLSHDGVRWSLQEKVLLD